MPEMSPFQYTQWVSEASLEHRSFEGHLHLQSELTPHPDCSGLVMGRDRPGSLIFQQQRPHRVHGKHQWAHLVYLDRLSLCRAWTPEPGNSKKTLLAPSCAWGPQGWKRGTAGGVGTREKGRKWGAYSTARLQPSSAIKETLHRPSEWQKALRVCSGRDLQLPTSPAWLRRQHRWNSSTTTAAPYRPLQEGLGAAGS